MPNKAEYIIGRLDIIEHYYFKGLGSKLNGLKGDLEYFREFSREDDFDPIAHANEMYLWVAKKYDNINKANLAKNAETSCLQDVPELIERLGKNIEYLIQGKDSNKNITSAYQISSDIIEKGQEFRKFINDYIKELEELGYDKLALEYKHKTTHNFGQ